MKTKSFLLLFFLCFNAVIISILLVVALIEFSPWVLLLLGLALYYLGAKLSIANQFDRYSIFHDVTTLHPKKLLIMIVSAVLLITGGIFVVSFFASSGVDLMIYLLSVFL